MYDYGEFFELFQRTAYSLAAGCFSMIAGAIFLCALAFVAFQYAVHYGVTVKGARDENENLCSFCKRKLPAKFVKKCETCKSSNCYRCFYNSTCASCFDISDLCGENVPNILQNAIPNAVISRSPSKNIFLPKNEVRYFIEQLLEQLIGANLDDAPLNQISNHLSYEYVMKRHHKNLSATLQQLSSALSSYAALDGESQEYGLKARSFYDELSLLIKQLIEDVATLPSLLLAYDDSFDDDLLLESQLRIKTYEEILSLAVINKVITRLQENKKEIEADSFSKSNISYKSDVMRETSDLDGVSLKIEERIEEIITTKYHLGPPSTMLSEVFSNLNLSEGQRAVCPELGKDIVNGNERQTVENGKDADLISNVSSWEDNWLFQKKKLLKMRKKCVGENKDPEYSAPKMLVPMLVPNPSENYRALIGDVDVDDTSDLSECSDSVFEEMIQFSRNDIKEGNAIVENVASVAEEEFPGKWANSYGRNGGRNLRELETDRSSGIASSISRDLSDGAPSSLSPCRSEDSLSWSGIMSEDKVVISAPADSGEGSLDTQEYECVSHCEFINGNAAVFRRKSDRTYEAANLDKNGTNGGEESDSSPSKEYASAPKPGTIAEREHLKWQHAVPMKNNPYTLESIQKRKSERFETRAIGERSITTEPDDICRDSTLNKYGRDYYVNGSTEKVQLDKGEGKYENGEISSSDGSNGKPLGEENENNNDNSDNRKGKNVVRVRSWCDRTQPEIRLDRKRTYQSPSVKQLARHFSLKNDNNVEEIGKKSTKQQSSVHSITARSMSKEYRNVLKDGQEKW